MNFIWRRFGTVSVPSFEDGTDSFPKSQHIKSRCGGITHKKEYTIHKMDKVWNQEISFFFKQRFSNRTYKSQLILRIFLVIDVKILLFYIISILFLRRMGYVSRDYFKEPASFIPSLCFVLSTPKLYLWYDNTRYNMSFVIHISTSNTIYLAPVIY
jgi:hypothetical protein